VTDVPYAESFHTKPWFKADEKAHGHDGPLHTEPHDLAPISQKLLESFESQGFPLHHDMFTVARSRQVNVIDCGSTA
jgi:hypothetical protein